MLRLAAWRLTTLSTATRTPATAVAAAGVSKGHFIGAGDSSSDVNHRSGGFVGSESALIRHFYLQNRGFALESLVHKDEDAIFSEVPATVAAVKNPTSKIVYDEYNHERLPPGDPSKRAFAYFVLTGGRFVYASLVRLLILKFVLSMSASKDVPALASLEVDLSSIESGSTVTVKWRGKPVFIRRRTEDDIKLANSVDVASLRHPQADSERVKNPEWLVVIGVCIIWVASLYLMRVISAAGFAHAMVLTMTSQAGSARAPPLTISRCPLTPSWTRTSSWSAEAYDDEMISCLRRCILLDTALSLPF